jgi:hypothetical protein
MIKINDRAMLVGVFTSLPGQTKLDRVSTNKFLEDNHAQEGSGKWSTVLWPDEATKVPRSIAGKLRARIDFLSGPYFVKGLRILPSGLYFDAMEEGRNHLPEFNSSVDDSVARMDEWIETQRIKANGLFRRELYPATHDQFRQMFSLDVRVLPMPESDNFLLLNLAQEAVNEECNNYRKLMEESVINNEQQLFSRLLDPILNAVKIIERLEAGEKPKVYQTLLGNIEKMVKVLPHLNLTGNAQLEELRLLAKGLVNQADTDSLKESSAVRKATLDQANAIIQKMKGYGS